METMQKAKYQSGNEFMNAEEKILKELIKISASLEGINKSMDKVAWGGLPL